MWFTFAPEHQFLTALPRSGTLEREARSKEITLGNWQHCSKALVDNFFKVNFQKLFLFYLWVILCSKVGDNGDFVFHSGTAINGVLNLAKNGSILVKISANMLANITIKSFRNVISSLKT